MGLTGIGFGVLMGAVPCCTMGLGSFVLLKFPVGPKVQAVFQNLSAGIILAAVAGELFPQLMQVKGAAGYVGYIVGFALAWLVIDNVEKVVDWVQDKMGLDKPDDGDASQSRSGSSAQTRGRELSVSLRNRDKIKEQLDDVANFITAIDEYAEKLESGTCTADEQEQMSERIDHHVHLLQYKTDRARRLLEADTFASSSDIISVAGEHADLRRRITTLKHAAQHLQEHIQEEKPPLVEMHMHMGEIDTLLHEFHQEVSTKFTTWRSWGAIFAAAMEADQRGGLPLGLVVAVATDAFVDGFLIGVASTLSQKSGLLLALATSIEMGFLGAAFSPSIWRHKESGRLRRAGVIILPCVLLVGSAAVGAVVGNSSRSQPFVYGIVLAFGTAALLFLATQELIIEAHEALEGKEGLWWVRVWLFVGVVLVLEVNLALGG